MDFLCVSFLILADVSLLVSKLVVCLCLFFLNVCVLKLIYIYVNIYIYKCVSVISAYLPSVLPVVEVEGRLCFLYKLNFYRCNVTCACDSEQLGDVQSLSSNPPPKNIRNPSMTMGVCYVMLRMYLVKNK